MYYIHVLARVYMHVLVHNRKICVQEGQQSLRQLRSQSVKVIIFVILQQLVFRRKQYEMGTIWRKGKRIEHYCLLKILLGSTLWHLETLIVIYIVDKKREQKNMQRPSGQVNLWISNTTAAFDLHRYQRFPQYLLNLTFHESWNDWLRFAVACSLIQEVSCVSSC